MREYHKINTIYKRDERGKIVEGEWATREIAYLAGCEWDFTEKVDGTNVRVMWDGKSLTFGGKTDNAQMPVKLLYALQALFEGTLARQRFQQYFDFDSSVCLYGEGYGASIQKAGSLYAPEPKFVLYDVNIGNWWLEWESVKDVAEKLGCELIPWIGRGALKDAAENARRGFKSRWGDFQAEGIVMRPAVPLISRKGERIIAKIKTKDFQNSTVPASR